VKDSDESISAQLMVHYVPELLKEIPSPSPVINLPLGTLDKGLCRHNNNNNNNNNN